MDAVTGARLLVQERKTRNLFLACCNIDRSECVLSMSLGNAKRPYAFKGKTGQEPGLDSYFNVNTLDEQGAVLWLAHLTRLICVPQTWW